MSGMPLFAKVALVGLAVVVLAQVLVGPMCFGCGGIEIGDEDMSPDERNVVAERMEREMVEAVEHLIYLTVGLVVAVTGGRFVWDYIQVDDP